MPNSKFCPLSFGINLPAPNSFTWPAHVRKNEAACISGKVLMTHASGTLGAFACLLGAAGVILAAASAHTSGNDLARTGSLFLIMHAAAVLGISAAARAPAPARALVIAGAALGIGSLLFSLDLASRAFLGGRLFAF